MTLSLLRNEIWQQIGEPSDLDPSSDTQYNSGPLLNFVVNEAQRYIAFWRNPKTGANFYFKNLFGRMNFEHQIITGTLDADSTSTTIVLPSGSSTTDDYYNDWVVTVGSENKLLVDYDGSSLTGTLPTSWSTTPESGDTYTLAKNFLWLLSSSHSFVAYHITLPSETYRYRADGNLVDILRILDLEDNRELAISPYDETYIATLTDTGTPTAYRQIGNTLYLDRVPDEDIWYRIDYLRAPTELSAATDEPEIPEEFHYGIVLWGRWWGYARQQASPEAYAAKRDLEDFLETRTGTQYFYNTFRTSHGILRRS